MTGVRYINVKEFREFGYLQELNRQYLHPMGLALSVEIHNDGTETLAGIWDYRDDIEGICYSDGTIDRTKADRVLQERRQRRPKRLKALGYWIQPLLSRHKPASSEQ